MFNHSNRRAHRAGRARRPARSFASSGAVASPLELVGGDTVVIYDDWEVRTFLSSSTLTSNMATVLQKVLVAAGGGPGGAAGSARAGGGGAGGIQEFLDVDLDGEVDVVVGDGGVPTANNGEDSSFGDLVSLGGGYGASGSTGQGSVGGSGGGARAYSTAGGNEAGTAGQGNAGGGGAGSGTTSNRAGGGGGGKGSVGYNAVFGGFRGAGGDGIDYQLPGHGAPSIKIGGGGEASGNNPGTPPHSSEWGGGATGVAGADNTAGGGGTDGAGGSGIILTIRDIHGGAQGTALAEAFAGANDAAWNADNWEGQTGENSYDISIQGNKGSITPDNGMCMVVSKKARADFDVTMDVSFGAQGVAQYPRFFFRTGDVTGPAVKSGYAIEFQVTEGRMVFMSLDGAGGNTWLEWNESFTLDATTIWGLRVQAIGSDFKIKLWDTAVSEPESWTLTRSSETTFTEAGNMGFTATGSFADPGTPTPLVIDNYTLVYNPEA